MIKIIKIIISIILSIALIYPLWNFISNAVISNYLIKQVGTVDNIPVSNGISTSTSESLSTSTPQAGQAPDIIQKKMTVQDVAVHNRADDCWLIINNKVYNVTNFLSVHPGGAGRIISFCGKDSTSAYNTKGGTGSHSSSAFNMLADYFIASIGQNVPSSAPATSQSPVKAVGTGSSSNAPKPASKPIQPSSAIQPSTQSSINLTMAEVAKHNVASNCWMVINNSVYDVTTFIPSHPGGSAMVPYCGKDGTQAFATKGGGGGAHSTNASGLLTSYYLGVLGSTASTGNTSSSATTHPTAPSGTIIPGEDEYENEDEYEYEYEY